MPRNPAISYAYKTAVLRVHNPSRHKRALLDDALTRNHRAYTKVLARLLPDIDHFSGFKPGKRRESAVWKLAAPLINPLPLSIGAKAGLFSDVAGQISSYIELRDEQDNPSPPTAARLNASQEEFEKRVTAFAGAMELDEENSARDDLFREIKAGARRPILFLKNRPGDGYLLLHCDTTDRYFVYLNLHARGSRFASKVSIDGLIDVRSGEVMKFTSTTGALFPVSFGRDFQFDRFIQRGTPQSAKLLERDGIYEVHVTFEYQTPKIRPARRLGVDRGIYNLASLAVVEDDGSVMMTENLDGRNLRHVQRHHERQQKKAQSKGRRYRSNSRRAMADEAVHTTANRIVDVALQHNAQVVLENLRQLTNRGGKRKRSSFNRVLNRSQYQKLQNVLEYKLAVAGLPKPVTVSAAYTSQTCPICGHQARENRPRKPDGDGFKMDTFQCQECGHKADADLNAARVIAMKRTWRETLPKSQRPKRMEVLRQKYTFNSYIKDRAAMRDSGP